MRRIDESGGFTDNAEASVKCSNCGAMFGILSAQIGETVVCPYCGAKSTVESGRLIDASDEDF